MEITVGQVSGVIAAAVFILQHVLPNAIVLILVSVLNNQSTAVTWSVVQRQISSTLWPVIFSSDSAASQGVDSKVIIGRSGFRQRGGLCTDLDRALFFTGRVDFECVASSDWDNGRLGV